MILVVGDVMLDRYWHSNVTRISPEAPIPIAKITRIDDRLGGAANVANNIYSMGETPLLIGVVGADPDGKRLASLLDFEGKFAFEGKTTVKLRVVSDRHHMLRCDFESPHDPTECFKRYQESVEAAALVVISDYMKGAVAHADMFIDAAKKTPVIVDPKCPDWDRYRGAALITPNRKEFEAAMGSCGNHTKIISKARDAAKGLGATILVTLGEEGMILVTPNPAEDPIRDTSVAEDVYDVTGAGDTVIAAMAVGMVRKWSWRKCLDLASKQASRVVRKFGTNTP